MKESVDNYFIPRDDRILEAAEAPEIAPLLPPVQGNAGCMLRVGDSLLVVRHAASMKWDIPSGKPLPGEIAHETAARETEEETGLKVRAVRLLEDFGGKFYMYACQLADKRAIDIKAHLPIPEGAKQEIAEVKFLDIARLRNGNVRYPSVLQRVKELFDRLPATDF
jgi:8-oxo-dGTP pyrophosphatase MutT (NUDIX family)